MTVQSALAFIARVRSDEVLRGQIASIAASGDLEAAVALGSTHGFQFSMADLQEAHRHDFTLRWLVYGLIPPEE